MNGLNLLIDEKDIQHNDIPVCHINVNYEIWANTFCSRKLNNLSLQAYTMLLFKNGFYDQRKYKRKLIKN